MSGHEFNTDPNAVIDLVQSRRLEILLSQSGTGKMAIPIDKDELKLMKDLGDTAKGQLQIQSNDSNTEAMREIAAATAELSMRQEAINPFQVGTGRDKDMAQLSAPELDAIEIADYEIIQGNEIISYDEVMTDKAEEE